MSEMIEKMLLIFVSLLSIFFLIPLFNPLLSQINYEPSTKSQEIKRIDEDMNIMLDNLNENSNISNLFSSNSTIFVYIHNKTDSYTNLVLSFYYNIEKFPIYRYISIDNNYNIIIPAYSIIGYNITINHQKNIAQLEFYGGFS